MHFYKDTIMGQVLTQVQDDKTNEIYFEQIDDLLEDISNGVYSDVVTPAWNKNGVVVTDREINPENEDPEWIYVETEYVSEYSWFIEQLVEIYNPKKTDMYRFLTTIGYLLTVYSEKYNDIGGVFKITAITSTVFLHPDHLGQDKFIVHPINLPPFGDEF